MSDHQWARENVAAYIMGGLSAAEVERIDRHLRGCPDCAAALAATQDMDRGLQTLFFDVRPGLELEDAAVRSTRTVRPRSAVFNGWLPRTVAIAASVLVLCTIGALAGAFVGDGVLPMPGYAMRSQAAQAEVHARVPAAATASKPDEMVTDLPSVAAGQGIVNYTQLPVANPTGNPQAGSGAININKITPPLNQHHRFDNGTIPDPAVRYLYTEKPSVPAEFGTGARMDDNVALKLKSGTPALKAANQFKPGEHRLRVVNPGPQEPNLVKQEAAAPGQKPASSTPAEGEGKTRRIVIRSGEMEFEVASFDAAVAAVTKLVGATPGAFVATINSEKLPNGKVKGAVTLRTPPEHLDGLVLSLRRDLGPMGELKGMRIGSQDITKQYTDLESRLRAARTMEQRLLQIIKDGKGEIKQLLEAEKELGVWRTKIEELEGEIRYYSNLVALATLTVTLTEKEIRSAASITESERVQAGVEVEDVDKAYRQTIAAVTELKGRISKSELKQLSAGQFNATLQFEVPHESGGLVRDRLRQLGRVARLEIDRMQHPVGGSLPSDAKVRRGDTLFIVQIYNVVNVAARETVTAHVAAADVRAAYQAIREAAGKATVRVLNAQINEADAKNVTAQLDVEIRRPEEGAVRAALDAVGEVVSRQVHRTPESDDTTDSKVLYRMTILAANRLSPRESTTVTVEVPDVDQAVSVLTARMAEAQGRQISANSSRDQSGKSTARLVYEVPLAAAGIVERFKSAGTVRSQQTVQDAQAPAGKLAKARFDVTLVNRDQIVADDNGLWPQVRRGLSVSVAVLLTSVTWVIFGLCVVLPWGVAAYFLYRLFRRRRQSTVAPAHASST